MLFLRISRIEHITFYVNNFYDKIQKNLHVVYDMLALINIHKNS